MILRKNSEHFVKLCESPQIMLQIMPKHKKLKTCRLTLQYDWKQYYPTQKSKFWKNWSQIYWNIFKAKYFWHWLNSKDNKIKQSNTNHSNSSLTPTWPPYICTFIKMNLDLVRAKNQYMYSQFESYNFQWGYVPLVMIVKEKPKKL